MKGQPVDYIIIAVYFVFVLGFGSLFGRYNRTTRDYFYGGQRFSWWLLSMSLAATTIGSYSFVKYSRVAYQYGLSSSMAYLNDWFWMPLFLFGWLPIVYFSRVGSIPEYFERRFNPRCRTIATLIILVYMVGYVGINFYTMGKVMNALLGWPVLGGAVFIAGISAIYVTLGGQTAVIMTDLVQGLILLTAGGLILYLGIEALGGWSVFWGNLPPDHRRSLAHFSTPAGFNFAGVFWQDGMANGVATYFFNQGIILRFMSAKSVPEARKAGIVMALVLMPLAAIAVGGAGWIGRAMTMIGLPLDNYSPDDIFVTVTNAICTPGVFGLVMAAMAAALMSTADTLINAVSSILVNDVLKTRLAPDRSDRFYLRSARFLSMGTAVAGLLLVPLYMSFGSIYAAHGAFTAAVAPPMAVTVLLGAFWKRFTARAAFWAMVGGMGLMFLSFLLPVLVAPLAALHGFAPEDELLTSHLFIRALFGFLVTGAIGVTVSLKTDQDKSEAELVGLVWGTFDRARWLFKSGEPNDEGGRPVKVGIRGVTDPTNVIRVSQTSMKTLGARVGDLGYLCHRNPLYGGLRSAHFRFGVPLEKEGQALVPKGILEEASLVGQAYARIEKII